MSSNIINKTKKGLFGTALMAGGSSAFAADWPLNMPKGVTENSTLMYELHMFTFWVSVAIGVVVFGIMIWSMLKHRKSQGAKPANFHESTSIEIAWTVVPFLILIAFAVKATEGLNLVEDNTKPELTIKVTGHKWKWSYAYSLDNQPIKSSELEKHVHFTSNRIAAHYDASMAGDVKKIKSFGDKYLADVDKKLVVPVGMKIKFLITADDVIHSWWVPALGLKRDAIPGIVNPISVVIPATVLTEPKAVKERLFTGKCAELCGRLHAFMPIVVKAVSKEDFYAWHKNELVAQVAAKKEAETKAKSVDWSNLASVMKLGKKAYTANCVFCHQAEGQGAGSNPPLKGAPVATGKSAAEHIKTVLKGKGSGMPPFARLSDTDLAAVITYERNAWGNKGTHKGKTIITPADIKAARKP